MAKNEEGTENQSSQWPVCNAVVAWENSVGFGKPISLDFSAWEWEMWMQAQERQSWLETVFLSLFPALGIEPGTSKCRILSE